MGMITDHFSENEMKCKGSGDCKMVPEFMEALEKIRMELNKPMIVSSGYRCPEYNDKVSGSGLTGPHTTGRAVDVVCSGGDALKIMELAIKHGMTGIGVSQKGDHSKRFLHLDMLIPNMSKPRPWVWSY